MADESKQSFRKSPIPAGFFDFDGRTCESFSGDITYVGPAFEESGRGESDAFISRDGDPISLSDPIGAEGTVDLDIVILKLTSVESITVVCSGEATSWNATVDLSETRESKGTLTATKEHSNGGTAYSTLFVYPRLTFVNVDDPTIVRVLDMAADGLAPIQLEAVLPWVHTIDPDAPDGKTGFWLGVDPATPSGSKTRCIRHLSSSDDHVFTACQR